MTGATPYRSHVVAMALLPEGEPMHSEMTTIVWIVDEACGEFVRVQQHGRNDLGAITINPEEWQPLRDAIDRLIAECEPETKDDDDE